MSPRIFISQVFKSIVAHASASFHLFCMKSLDEDDNPHVRFDDCMSTTPMQVLPDVEVELDPPYPIEIEEGFLAPGSAASAVAPTAPPASPIVRTAVAASTKPTTPQTTHSSSSNSSTFDANVPAEVDLMVKNSDAWRRHVLVSAEEALLSAYILLDAYDAFGLKAAFRYKQPHLDACELVNNMPDTLYIAFLILHRVNLNDAENCNVSGEHSFNTRKHLAAILLFAHKFCSSVRQHDGNMAKSVVQALSYHCEVPNTECGWQRLINSIELLEGQLLIMIPGISLLTDSPFHYMELYLKQLSDEGRICTTVASMLRGCAFFFVGSCMLNTNYDAHEELMARFGSRLVGESVALVLLSCVASARSPCRRYRPQMTKRHEQCGLLMLDNGLAPFASKLRWNLFYGGDHFVILSEKVLRRVRPLFFTS